MTHILERYVRRGECDWLGIEHGERRGLEVVGWFSRIENRCVGARPAAVRKGRKIQLHYMRYEEAIVWKHGMETELWYEQVTAPNGISDPDGGRNGWGMRMSGQDGQ